MKRCAHARRPPRARRPKLMRGRGRSSRSNARTNGSREPGPPIAKNRHAREVDGAPRARFDDVVRKTVALLVVGLALALGIAALSPLASESPDALERIGKDRSVPEREP